MSSSAITLQKSLQESLEDDVSEVLVKDCNGNYEVQIPCLPPPKDDQLQDESTEQDSMQAVESNELKHLAYAGYRD